VAEKSAFGGKLILFYLLFGYFSAFLSVEGEASKGGHRHISGVEQMPEKLNAANVPRGTKNPPRPQETLDNCGKRVQNSVIVFPQNQPFCECSTWNKAFSISPIHFYGYTANLPELPSLPQDKISKAAMNTPLKQSSPRLHGLDTLRSLAILSVILYHLYTYQFEALPEGFEAVAQFCWAGVDLFFVLSGYLISKQYLRPYLSNNRPNAWNFYRNRLFRILPPYFAVLSLYYLLPIWRETPALPPFWQFLTFTQNLLVTPTSGLAFSHAWSLCVEEHFYLLLPPVVFLLMRRPSLRKASAVIAGLVLLGVGIRGSILWLEINPIEKTNQPIGFTYLRHIFYPTYCRLDGLLAGVTLALVETFRPLWWSRVAKRGHSLLISGAFLIGIALWLCRNHWNSASGSAAYGILIGFPILATGLALLVASALSTNGLLGRINVPGARLIATLAFSLYLTHKEAIHLVKLYFPVYSQMSKYHWLGLYTFLSLAISATLYCCIERPFLILRDLKMPQRKGIAT
jgi:peptidoglycan/LPS O-acetylase OafA/YrhL